MAALPPSGSALGLGLRRSFLAELAARDPLPVDFLETSPENWFRFGGRPAHTLRQLSERVPLLAHGLSLSIGGPDPLDRALLDDVARFLEEHGCPHYSEHLAFCRDGSYLHDLLPIPFNEDTLRHCRDRIVQVQDILERPLLLENTAYYGDFANSTLSETEFFCQLVHESDCRILLDINNLYVNSRNHGYDALSFLRALPAERVVYLHLAGHAAHPSGQLIDTHDRGVSAPVLQLLREALAYLGPRPILLEWDHAIPRLDLLLEELGQLAATATVAAA
ncbi:MULTISPECIES: DUF692 domain-containing protein [Acidithiobacillus]|jgi:uncharacterized protein (UPF0276 family)|uniref:Uncharacterized protein n=3 Tax=Acidithiobacillus caldus TaxID=33059 RepID=F9ZQ74_ACICS|nr:MULTISPECIES: DUF692 domain-containing protein [Acidithiobacillus]AEK56910.1 conserved hypothetical protein [Acidithiobacillus caldus SM-1]AIA54177.1 hypothetical protein Acaty_c0287 [Acidithiobacillus caldus ATCC 51756]AUW31708.1 DUF692 domain-containing protein [Acidithiobacillus caldus]MBU2730031.1 DUF692 domain-containing protein [Acidithiobacillus caldus]MBU2736881.1 DUF692 domain-containing protein [Acidithiobacillus caldus ATCC 51756]